MGVTHTSRPCVGNPGWGGEGRRLRMGVEGPELQDLDEEERVRGEATFQWIPQWGAARGLDPPPSPGVPQSWG